jgi:outer membrane PBP1 activator LpoA protein
MLLALYSCTTTTPNDPPPQPPKPPHKIVNTTIETPIASSPFSMAEQLIEKSRYEKNEATRTEYLLTAIKIYLQQKQGEKARNHLKRIDSTQLSLLQRDNYHLYQAETALYEKDTESALFYLQQPVSHTDAKFWLEYHLLRAEVFKQQEKYIRSAQETILRNSLLNDMDAIEENQKEIWQTLAQAPISQLKQHPNKQDILSGWVELQLLIRRYTHHEEMQSALQFWHQAYPNHPIHKIFLDEIIQQRQALLTQAKHIAILLPLSGTMQQYGQAILEGILAAHYAKKSPPILTIYDTKSDYYQAWQAYQEANDAKADFIIGPLDKKTVSAFSQMHKLFIPVLALNRSEQDIIPKNFYQFSLYPENEAKKIALKAYQQGYRASIILYPDNSWGKRMQKAFSDQWKSLQAHVAESQKYSLQEHDYTPVITQLLNLDEGKRRYKLLKDTLGTRIK